jgi:hypothetical protein
MGIHTYEKINKETFKVYTILHKYSMSQWSKGKPWHNRGDLMGLCEIGAKKLSQKLQKLGLKAKINKGCFDTEEAGGNGNQIKKGGKLINLNLISHCWVEIKIGEKTLICDPTNKQFINKLHPHPNYQPPTPLIAWKTGKHGKAYKPLPEITKKKKRTVDNLGMSM